MDTFKSVFGVKTSTTREVAVKTEEPFKKFEMGEEKEYFRRCCRQYKKPSELCCWKPKEGVAK